MKSLKMVRKFILIIELLTGVFLSPLIFAQAPIVVAETTLKVGLMGEEFFFLGFAGGDKMIFSFEEANGKELKEVEITEISSSFRFIEYKTNRITKKIIEIKNTGIYKFRFTNGGIGLRLCNYTIQRIPASLATQNFNTTVYTHLVDDTTYVNEEEDVLEKTDTVITNFQDRVIKVNAATTTSSNKANFNFILPENTVAWSYYISTDKAGQQVFDEANKKLISVSAPILKKFPFYNLLSAIAAGREAPINKLQTGEDISYWIMDGDNSSLFSAGLQFRFIKKGKVINDYSRMEPRKGNLFFCFSNDNATEPVTVTVKITAIRTNEELGTRQGKRMIITPRNKMYLKN
jgi:hypothetical protein